MLQSTLLLGGGVGQRACSVNGSVGDEGEWLYKSRKPKFLKGFSAYWVVNLTEFL